MRDDKPTEKITLLKSRDKKNAIATLFLLVINEYGDYQVAQLSGAAQQ
ncbi:hypothetical protein [Psychrobacter glaciei]|nr:hypothetical protein [Psychrobacter glaciei]MCH1783873.1 hypothetical protein [Psychrobacter glaciei]